MGATEPQRLEAVVLGRVGVDLYPHELETPLSEVRTFTRFVGGFAGNVATGLARLGVRTAIASRVGEDGHGDFVRRFLAGEGVDVRFLATDPDWLTPPTFCEIWPPDRFPLTFYRRPTAPDWQLSPDDFDPDEVAAVPLLFATGTALAQSPSRETTLAAMRTHLGTTVFDLDWRPTLWTKPEEYAALAAAAVAAADLVVGNEEEVEAARIEAGQPGTIDRLVLKRGERGATVFEDGEKTDVAGFPVEVVNGLGAGDAFAAALGHGLLRGLSTVEAAGRATVAGALVASQLACSEAMPRLEELERSLRDVFRTGT
ncbi:MAG: 5-dehydro-2-deoxygluconokinase [Gaiellaceae bacterium MAG52_C11]|nr:5-dehydro-2-deoxygluconokinase [Candidatus Gaiellasilicea maunaloa]